ncbi:PhoH family protein [Ferrovibrio sp.]|uniref:PhoH family protein n=1 Tax=Ferrovibrio sp. TaxID=1917215 RepID=UPI00311E1E36
MSDARGAGSSGQPITLEFDDNRLLALLAGEHDRHLAQIEQKLDVAVTPRGNLLMISGDGPAQQRARAVLNELYGRLAQGRMIEMGDVDGAIRMALAEDAAQGGPMNAPVITKSRDRNTAAGGGDRPVPEGAVRTTKRLIIPRSPVQKEYLTALSRHELVFGLGPAGTGKTYLAVAMAVSMLLEGRVDRIILSRPAVEAGERLGFLPGDMREKIDPYLRPLYDALYDMLPAERVAKGLESGEIEVAPLAFMRGRTLANAFVILDESQNTSPVQMKMLLTRLGENSRLAVTGDLSQIDLPIGVPSGLRHALDILDGTEGISFVRFGEADVVRHPLVTKIVRAYAQHEQELGLGRPDANGRPPRR